MKLYFANPVQRGDGGGRSRAKRAAWAKPAVMCDVPVTVRKLPQVGLGHRHLDGAAAFEPETAHRLHRSEHRKAAEGPSIHAVAPRRHVPILGAETRGRLGRLAAGRGRFAMIVIELLFGLMLAGMVLLVLPFLLLMAGIASAVLLWVLAPASLVALLIFWLVFPGLHGVALLLLALVIGLMLFEQRARRRPI